MVTEDSFSPSPLPPVTLGPPMIETILPAHNDPPAQSVSPPLPPKPILVPGDSTSPAGAASVVAPLPPQQAPTDKEVGPTIVNSTPAQLPLQNLPSLETKEIAAESGECFDREIRRCTVASVLKSAKRGLGYGYDRSKLCTISQVVEVTDLNIDTFEEHDTKFIISRDFTVDDADLADRVAFGSKAKSWISKNMTASAGSGRAKNKTKSSSKEQLDLSGVFSRINSTVCKIKKLPTGIANPIGDSLVNQVTVSVGYKVSLKVFSKLNQTTQKSDLKAEADSDLTAKFDVPQVGEVLDFTAKIEATFDNSNHSSSHDRNKRFALEAIGIGGYHPKVKTSPMDWQEAMEAIHDLDSDFLNSQHMFNNQDLSIDPTSDLIDYSKLMKSVIPDNELDNELPLLAPSAKNLGETAELLTIAENIKLPGIDVAKFLEKFIEIVGNTAFESRKFANNDNRAVYVMGKSGLGKSTLIAYLMGHALKFQKYVDPGSGAVKDVFDYGDSEFISRPTIGHGEAMTKGCHVYSANNLGIDFVDCAGALDSSGIEADICNAMSLSVMFKRRPPFAMLFVVNVDTMTTDNTRTGFAEYATRLENLVRSATLVDILPSIFFVVNDKKTFSTYDEEGNLRSLRPAEIKDSILNGLKLATSACFNERRNHHESKSRTRSALHNATDRLKAMRKDVKKVLKVRKNNLAKDKFDSEWFDIQAHDDYSDINAEANTTLDEKIRCLKLVRYYSDHIHVMSLRDKGKSGELLMSHVCGNEDYFSHKSFTPERFYNSPNCNDIFLTSSKFCYQSALYYNSLCNSRDSLIGEMERIVQRMILTVRIGPAKSKTTAIEGFAKEIEDKNLQIVNAQILVACKKEQIDILLSDKTPCLLATVRPKTAIRPRSWVTYSTGLAKRYTFVYNTPSTPAGSPIPIHSFVEYKQKGEFAVDIRKELGTLTAKFTPGYYGFSEDVDARIDVFVESKYHSSNLQKAADLSKQKLELENNIDLYKLALTGLVEKKILEENCIQNKEMEWKAAYTKKIKDLEVALNDCMTNLQVVLEKLSSFKGRVGIIVRDVITSLELHNVRASSLTEQQEYSKYLIQLKGHFQHGAKCSNSHTCIMSGFDNSQDTSGQWKCSRVSCKKYVELHPIQERRWLCLQCNENVCHECHLGF